MIIFREVDKNENAHAPYECAFAHTVLWVSYVIYHTHTHTHKDTELQVRNTRYSWTHGVQDSVQF